MQISLKKAVNLKGLISSKIQELIEERHQSAFVEAAKDEEYEKPPRSMDEITSELNEIRKDYRKLDVLATKANNETFVTFDSETMNLVEALELAKQLRGEHSILRNFARQRKQDRVRYYSGDNEVFTFAQYDPQEYKAKAEALKKKADKLSDLIDDANITTKLEFEAASKYIEE